YVLVTGGLGFIGSHTCVELLKAGYHVIIVDDLSNSYREVLDGILAIADRHFADLPGQKRPGVEVHHISYRDQPAMRSLLELHSLPSHLSAPRRSRIVGVVHFAAYKAVEESIRQPLKYYQNNINGLVDFMTLLDEFSIKTFIFSSSAAVYGSLSDGNRSLSEGNCVHQYELRRNAGCCPPGEKLPQSGCTDITNPYGRTKYFAEAILSDLVISDPTWNVVVLRYFNPIGCDASGLLSEDPRGVPSNLLPVVAQVVTGQRSELLVYGDDWDTRDGTAIRDFIHVSDLARGHTAALAAASSAGVSQTGGGGYRTYNLGAGRGHSILEVIGTMEAASGSHIPYRVVDRRAGDVQSSVAGVDRARDELGWQTEESLATACRDICNAMQ
ncbi:hypothetical protein BX600DRAFT_356206, partial [Xylariales sp. PMI_506]